MVMPCRACRTRLVSECSSGFALFDTSGMADFESIPADRVEPSQLHAAFGAAFADYLIGPFQLPLAQWPQFLGRQGVELAPSRVAVRGGEVLAFCLVAPRPALARWRLGTMGAVPAARGSGVAAALLDDFIARAKEAGQAGVELECFAQNERALRLYRGRGFAVLHPLHGYTRKAGAAPTSGAAHPVALDDAYAWLEHMDLPLQVTPPSLRALPVALQAWRNGTAQVVVSEGAGQQLAVHSLVDKGDSQACAEALVAALLQRYAGWTVNVPQLQRPDVGGDALERLDFARLPLHQLYLRRDFAS